jgi:hypothetical protein
VLWNEKPSIRVCESPKQCEACSEWIAKRSLGHSLVEARCDGFSVYKKEISKASAPPYEFVGGAKKR